MLTSRSPFCFGLCEQNVGASLGGIMKKTALTIVILALATTAFAAKVIKRGAPLSKAKPVALATVLAAPHEYMKEPVIVEGVIDQACTAKGCWMQLAPAAGKPGVRVTFKDYGFFIPLNARGMQARAEGMATVKTLSKEEVDHLTGEGATLIRNADGTAEEVSFVANGVELRPGKS
jgi:hypothetical protein